MDGRFPGFNSLKGILSLIKSIIPSSLEFLSNLVRLGNHETINCSKGNFSSICVFHNKRRFISFVIKEVGISNLFLTELIFNCPIIIRFGFSRFRFL